VFLDVGSYSIGSAVMVMWPGDGVFSHVFLQRNLDPDLRYFDHGGVILGIPVLILIQASSAKSPPRALQPPTPRSLRPARRWRILDCPVGNRDRRRHPAVVGQSGRSSHHGFVDHWFRKPGPAGQGGQQALFTGLQLRRRHHGDGVVGVHSQLYGDRAEAVRVVSASLPTKKHKLVRSSPTCARAIC
jgi:hypothetical protein